MKSIVISMAVLCLFATNMNAQEIVPFGGNGKRPFLNENIKRADLLRLGSSFSEQLINDYSVSDMTPEQYSAIKELVLSKNKRVLQLNNQLNEKQAQLQTLESSEKPDLKSINKIIDEIGTLIVSRMKTEAECKQKVRNVLTDEQRIEFDLKF